MTHNQLLIDMLMKLSNMVMRADELGGSRDWLVAELSVIISHAQDGPHERMFTESEVRAMMDDMKAIAADHSRKCYTNRIEQMTPPAPVAFIIDDYLQKKHGITT